MTGGSQAATSSGSLSPGKARAPSWVRVGTSNRPRVVHTGNWRTCLEADDVTAALRRRVSVRVAELEDAIVVRRERLVALARASATVAPTLADVSPLLDRLPILAGMLDAARQGERRALSDSLQLDVVYQPAESVVDAAATLYDLGSETVPSAAPRSAENWYSPPAGAGLVLRRVVRLTRRLVLE
jgi:hypothetical protein